MVDSEPETNTGTVRSKIGRVTKKVGRPLANIFLILFLVVMSKLRVWTGPIGSKSGRNAQSIFMKRDRGLRGIYLRPALGVFVRDAWNW